MTFFIEIIFSIAVFTMVVPMLAFAILAVIKGDDLEEYLQKFGQNIRLKKQNKNLNEHK